MSKTPIQWTEQTWNPIRGCSPISPGCKNCYAEKTGGRFCGPGKPFEGFVQIGKNGDPGAHWTGKVELIEHMLEIPLRTRKPTTWFVNSMSDLFHENLNPSDRWKCFDVMRRAPWHTYQILTKRALIMLLFMKDWERLIGAPPKNWWLGVSVEDRMRKDRIDTLRETPAAVRFVSFEPLLEDLGELNLKGIDLAIWGGESGPNSRECDFNWIRHGMRQATRDGCRNFVKQLGAKPYAMVQPEGYESPYRTDPEFRDRKGGDPSEWPHDLRVREMPEVRHA